MTSVTLSDNKIKFNIKAYFQLVKFRLSTTVVMTSVFGYIIALKWQSQYSDWMESFNWLTLLGVFIGGFLTVFASNGLNQVIEKEKDALMSRTADRPVVNGSLTLEQARIFSVVCGILGFLCMVIFTNFVATLLSTLSLVMYVFIYTPMKSVNPLAVMIGAIPGALPPLIGYTAFTNSIDNMGMILFLVQFFWQFPHFWAIAWLLHDDYQKAGYWLLPSGGGRDKKSAMHIVAYTLILVIFSMVPFVYHNFPKWSVVTMLLVNTGILWFATLLLRSLEVKSAKSLLYFSLIYTPIFYLVYIFALKA